MQRHISAITQGFQRNPEKLLSELEKMARLVKQPNKKHSSNQRSFVQALIAWVAVKLILFRSINDQLFREMTQRMNSAIFVPVYRTLKPRIKALADIHRRLPEPQEKSCCSLMGEKNSTEFSWRLLCL
jgi:hypothetical protein